MNIIIFAALSFALSFSLYAKDLINPRLSIELSESEIVIDGGASLKVVCPHEAPGKDNLFKAIKFKNIDLSLRCHNDYLGGLYLSDAESSGNFILGQKDADAGDTWNIHTLIFFNEKNELISWKINYNVYDKSVDCQTMTEEEKKKNKLNCVKPGFVCKKTENFYQWNNKKKLFTEISFKSKLPKRRLAVPENYEKNCPIHRK